MTEFFQNWESVARTLAALLISGLIGLGAHFLVFSLIQRLARRTPSPVADAFLKHCRGPWKLLEFIQKNYPESLPRLRAELASGQGIRGE